LDYFSGNGEPSIFFEVKRRTKNGEQKMMIPTTTTTTTAEANVHLF
jgi:hypothetical protein